MQISIKAIFLSFLLLQTAYNQIAPPTNAIPASTKAPATTLTYMTGNGLSAMINVPNVQQVPSTLAPTSTPTPAPAPTAPTTAPDTNASASAPAAPLPSTAQADQITPNSYTLSNLLQSSSLTTNPPASNMLNTGYYDYQTSTTAFTSLSQLKKVCNGQTQLKFVAFKQYSTQYYVTSNLYFLSLTQNTSPSQQQLFTAIQNIDCTWSFQSGEGLYLSLNTAFSYLVLSQTISSG
jgi:hypothetical protein